MTERGTFHFRSVATSDQLQRVIELLKERPHTTMEGIQASGIAAFPACVSEINHNIGYSIGRVMRTFGKSQVHTYVLLSAPCWTPRWEIQGKEIVPVQTSAHSREPIASGNGPDDYFCVSCGVRLPDDHRGSPYCDRCKELTRMKL